MAIGRPMPPLILDDTERETLERWVRRPKTAQGLALRARIILGCTNGRSNIAVAAALEVCMAFPVLGGVPGGLEVWPESHRPGFALRQADVFQSYMAQ